MTGDQALREKLLVTFNVEARQRLRQLTAALARVEDASATEPQAAVIEHMYREAHSLKGAARSVNVSEVESLCRVLEDVFVASKKQPAILNTALIGLLYRACEATEDFLAAPDIERSRIAAALDSLASRLMSEAGRASEAGRSPNAPIGTKVTSPSPDTHPAPHPPQPDRLPESARLTTAKLDALLFAAEELGPAKVVARDRAMAGRTLQERFTAWHRDRRPEHELDLKAAIDRLANDLERDHRALVRTVEALQQETRKARLLPVADAFEAYPRMVRELARDQAKEVAFEVDGGHIEIDRHVLAAMKDPVLHLLRNSIDHGIEAPEVRERTGKPRKGTIRLTIRPRSEGTVMIRVTDDGAGIDVEKIIRAAQRAGLVEAGPDSLDRKQALTLMFASGLSTSPMVTSLSGRGLGLSIVRERVEAVNGRVDVDTAPGKGTTFTLNLPSTMSTFRGVRVHAAGQTFVVPTLNVERVLQLQHDAIGHVENREVISFGDAVVPLVPLTSVLDLATPPRRSERLLVLILRAAGTRMAFVVDAVFDEQEVLVKTLGQQLSRVRNIMGGAVLTTGEVALVLNVSDLLKSAARLKAVPASAVSLPAHAPAKGILVAEDSITTRMLLKHVLEAAGYRVRVAADGIEALTILKNETADLVVSDVEMPKLDGFGLVQRVRSDKQLADLPVVLVTARESREDKERGLEVGANAYLVKSSFDQSDLLDVVRRLIGASDSAA